MEARMAHPIYVVPEALKGLLAYGASAAHRRDPPGGGRLDAVRAVCPAAP